MIITLTDGPTAPGTRNTIIPPIVFTPPVDDGVAFAALAASPSHADHLFGRGWFRHQTHCGVAVAEGGRYGWYRAYSFVFAADLCYNSIRRHGRTHKLF